MSNNNKNNNNSYNHNNHHNNINQIPPPSYTTPATPPNDPPNALNFDPNFTHYDFLPQLQLQQQPTPQQQMGQQREGEQHQHQPPPPSSPSPSSSSRPPLQQQQRSSRFFRRTTPNTLPLDTSNSVNYTYIRNDNGLITVYQQPSKIQKYHLITPSSNNPHVSIISKQTSDILWDAKVVNSEENSEPNEPKITPTANWECQNNVIKNNSNNNLNSQNKNKKNHFNLRPQKTLIKFNKQYKGYACTWNGRVFLWKLYGSGGNIYCTEGLSELGRKVAEFDDKSNTVTIDLNGRLFINEVMKANNNNKNKNNNNNPYQLSTTPTTATTEKLGMSLSQKSLSPSITDEVRDAAEMESFESFILLTGLIAKNSAKKLQNPVKRMSNYGDNTYLFNYTPFFVCCGILQLT